MRNGRKYLITILVGIALTAWCAISRGLLEQTEMVKIYHILCDSFFVSGVLITGVGLLIFSTNEGTFDMIVYGTKSFLGMFKKNLKPKHATFYDYRVANAEKKLSFGYLVISGLLFLAISFVFYYCYYQSI